MNSALGVLALPEAELESQLNQVGDVTGFGVGCCCLRGHNGLEDSEGVAFYRLIGGSLMLQVLICRVRRLSSTVCPWASGGFLGLGRHGLPQSSPTPKKPTFSQVGPGIAWIIGYVGPCVHILIGFPIKGGTDIGE